MQEQQREVIAPASMPQELFINSDADITIGSGSAGSSKSYSILLRWLRFANVPHSRGIVFRKTSTQLTAQGGLWEDAQKLYGRIYGNKLKISIKHMKLTFPSGASLKFEHFESEKVNESKKGIQADFIAFDEATEFSEGQITYMFSRNRNTDVPHRGTICMATNPHCDSFLKDWVWWWLDPETGIPDPAKRGIVRYFVKQREGALEWYDTREEAEEIYGTGDDNGVKSMCVIGSTIYDNPYIHKSYITDLKSLKRVEQDRLLYGSWTAREESSGYFKQEWLGDSLKLPDGRATTSVRSWDLAASKPSEVYPNPDWTAGVKMTKNKDKRYVIEHVVRFRDLFLGVEQRIIEQAYIDGKDTIITLPKDVGSSAQSYVKGLQAKIAELGFTVRLVKPVADKITRFAPFAAMAEAGFVSYVDDSAYPVEEKWNHDYFNELEVFDGTRKNKRDQVDATSDAFNYLRTTATIPSFTIASFTQANRFSRD